MPNEPNPETKIIDEANVKSETPFYPDIAHNRLYFHGTPVKEWRDGIIKNGLRPPSAAVSKNTIARIISFTDFSRYTSSDGAIIGLEPAVGEITEVPPQYVREHAIAPELNHLPPERATFYIPGNSHLPREVFERTQQTFGQYFENGHNDHLLLSEFGRLVTDIEAMLRKEAVFLHDKSPQRIHQIAQDIVWNQVCGYASRQADDLAYYSEEITKIREGAQIVSREQLTAVLKQESTWHDFDTENYLNNLRFLSRINQIKGLGFENLSYELEKQRYVNEVGKWLETLPSQAEVDKQKEERGVTHRLRDLVTQLRGARK